MNEIMFHVQGSSDEPYEVVFRRQPVGFTASCTCVAGANGQSCKHRINLILGVTTDVVSGNISAIPLIQSWVSGSAYETAAAQLFQAEQEFEQVKKRVAQSRKLVGLALRSGDIT
ncbi:hypothetical protein [Paraburkholderia xenovorans]|nr:hypothetical protein [Paraburkholderia xenovorans]